MKDVSFATIIEVGAALLVFHLVWCAIGGPCKRLGMRMHRHREDGTIIGREAEGCHRFEVVEE